MWCYLAFPCTHMEVRGHLYFLPFLRQGLIAIVCQASWAISIWGFSCLCPPSCHKITDCGCVLPCPALPGSGEANSGPHTCATNALSIEPDHFFSSVAKPVNDTEFRAFSGIPELPRNLSELFSWCFCSLYSLLKHSSSLDDLEIADI